ncbi:MAG TPA: acetyl-CoA carboxylase carboxyltransferase subunit beta [Acholeplasmataceae bacterium]|jgi:acetyl-CoA carboxylase carboxyl transferase subunit beta|nr:acetyl-CoA carboxylase carboxyltransferase subunit beta [Acholeplasmataceae bacterium]
MNNFFDDRKAKLETYQKNYRGKKDAVAKVAIPDNIFLKCPHCREFIIKDDYERSLSVCPKCNFHERLTPRERIVITCDSFEELFSDLNSANPLDFPGYPEKLKAYREETAEEEAVLTGIGILQGHQVAIAVLNSFFMMGSMGSVVGEKITRLVEKAIEDKLPLIIFSASGGARMQEGIFSLMQMAKTAAAIKRFSEAGLLYISVLTNPTTGGVLASFAFLGDVIIAEPGALIGFAGKRVIQQTIKQDLPSNFQSAEFQLEKGFVDMLVSRDKLNEVLIKILRLHEVDKWKN